MLKWRLIGAACGFAVTEAITVTAFLGFRWGSFASSFVIGMALTGLGSYIGGAYGRRRLRRPR